jgi:hypothetical protein
MKAAVAMWWDIAPEVRAEWEEWHSHEHMPERLSIPGFLRGTRYIALSGEPSYFVLYEAADLSVITSGPYLERLNNPTPWSRKMMPHHRNMVRALCEVREGWGGGVPCAMGTVRSSRRPVMVPKRAGLTSAHLLEAQPMPGTTTEQRIRGADATTAWVLLVGGYDAQAVPGELYRPAYSLTAGEIA